MKNHGFARNGSIIVKNEKEVDLIAAKSQSKEVDDSQEQKPDLQNAFSGLISRAKEGLASSSKLVASKMSSAVPEEVKQSLKSETELEWEQIEQKMSRALKVINQIYLDLSFLFLLPKNHWVFNIDTNWFSATFCWLPFWTFF